ncbi:hypothetical protein ECG_07544 [Echinococcus granulosus]|nr:hypothetical protein ECG_07544 [Echinococcus granulosus]
MPLRTDCWCVVILPFLIAIAKVVALCLVFIGCHGAEELLPPSTPIYPLPPLHPQDLLYARLTDKKEATPSRRTSSRSASTAGLNSNLGRQRRCAPRSSVGRGRKSTVHNPTTAGATATAAAAAAAADGLDGDVTAGKGSSSTRGSGNKGDAVRLGPLHIDITSPTSTASSGRKSGGDDDQMASKRDLFSIAALTAVEEREEASSSMVKSSQEQQQQQQQQQSQAYSPQVPQSPQLRPNGHPLTPAQWLERLSNNRGGEMAWNKGGIGMAEEEMRQLTHLLFTDRVFTEQVGRLPSVVQIMAFYHHHQQQQQQQEQLRQLQQPHTPSSSSSSSSSSCSPTTAQSFSNTFNSQQNSLGAGAPQTGAMHPPAALTTNKAFPPPPHPPLPFTPPTASATALAAAAAAVVGCGGSGGSLTTTTATTTIATANLTSIATYFPTPVNSTSAATTTPIHLPPPPPPPPPPLSHSPIFFNSTATAVAAALAAGIRPTAPVFQGQALSLSTGQFLPAPPISNAGTSAPPVPHSSLSHHPFMPNSPHLSTLWGGHHHLPRLQPPASDFPYLVVCLSRWRKLTLFVPPLSKQTGPTSPFLTRCTIQQCSTRSQSDASGGCSRPDFHGRRRKRRGWQYETIRVCKTRDSTVTLEFSTLLGTPTLCGRYRYCNSSTTASTTLICESTTSSIATFSRSLSYRWDAVKSRCDGAPSNLLPYHDGQDTRSEAGEPIDEPLVVRGTKCHSASTEATRTTRTPTSTPAPASTLVAPPNTAALP